MTDCPEIMSPIESNLQQVRSQIDGAIAALPLPLQKPVVLVAVSKTRPSSDVREAFNAGQRDFGENYVQEALVKIDDLRDLRSRGLIWHFIGPLQSNKLKLVAANFDWVHGVDRLKVATALSRHRAALSPDQNALNICVQVNVSGEASKGGVTPAEVQELAAEVSTLPHLKLRGLMTIIEDTRQEATQRAQFCKMRTLFESMRGNCMPVDTLSMGMSQDFAMAIAEGATMLRIGSAIFGARQ
jgi:pyridoxal phosphate enzyme (YggS family)